MSQAKPRCSFSQINEFTNGKGIDVVIDSVGGQTAKECIKRCKHIIKNFKIHKNASGKATGKIFSDDFSNIVFHF